MPTATETRANLPELINRVVYRGERVPLTRHGKPVAALISMEDLRLFEKLLEQYEDRLDIAAARAAEKEIRKKGAISSGSLRKKLESGR